ncbi:uncharacterized protein FA14DRAFT_155235 [Meira miltonrushii]|uniref:Mid2 domain-containing protein n=1 Tax=Meira miltonrushii TaxID=1280837 RepID=A0A316VHK4_9BASI|nr:uncharacterized protein FA14DRAFT_155235 [Meira miltonrushii]PWN35823.1 hypothetical protein FA14DRAFT_155235 [Meira miltonrushii]
MIKLHAWSTLLVCMLSFLARLAAAFQIDYDYSTCNALIVSTQVSPQELNSTNGMVLQFTQSRNLSDPALFNTTIAWTDFVPYETFAISSLLPATQIGNKYYSTNISMTDAMNASWVGSGYDQEFHTIMWLYVQPPNTTAVSARTSYGGPGNPFVPTSDAHPACTAFYTVNGTRTDYNPNLLNSDNDDESDSGDGLSKPAKIGLIIGCIVLTLLLLALVAILAFVFISAVRHMVKSWLRRRKRELENFGRRPDEENQNTTPEHLSDDDVIKGKKRDEDTITEENASFGGLFHGLNGIGTQFGSRMQDVDTITPTQLPARVRNPEDEAPPPTYTEANKL